MDAVLIIDKPAGMTSHDVVARVRRIVGEKSVGHLGTLDPMATGVLPLVLGRFTRLAQFYNDADKRYEGTIRFGWATDTYDAEGQPAGPKQSADFTLQQVQDAAEEFIGRNFSISSAFFRQEDCRYSRASPGAQRTASRTKTQAGRNQRAGVLLIATASQLASAPGSVRERICDHWRMIWERS